MGLIGEFKDFINKGNVMDLAVGVIIGGAFGKIVESLVGDIVMPIIGVVTGGGVDFSNIGTVLDGKTYASIAEAKKAGALVLGYGNFITILINFLFLAAAVFMLVKMVKSMEKPPAPAPAPETPEDVKLLKEIRDLLKK